RIGVDLPLNGEDGALGEPVLNGAILAVEEANARGEIVLNGLNYRLELVTHDDAVDGKQNQLQGARNALDFSQDPQMLAVVGPYDSSLVPVVVPRLNAAGLAQISPADTNTGSTTDPNLRRSGKVTYFRVCATDDLQAQAISQYVFGALHLQKIYVLDDTTVYGKGLADSVERYFKEMGATVVAHEGMPPEMTDFKKLIDDIMLTNAEAVVYGGAVNDNMELMSEQIKTNTVVKRSGRDFPPFVLVGGPGNLESRFISLVGPEAEGSYATLIGMDARYFPPATHFVEAYNARFGAAIGVYSVNGYQAVRIIVDAIRRAGTFDREAVRQALAGIQLTGEPMDMIVFDENGDSRSSWISIYQVRNGLWTFVDQLPANR
ncbi:MAG TPA: branched-chain amino acid ABC transporter substrate-binding protein, partial [Chloroflexia bacterium]